VRARRETEKRQCEGEEDIKTYSGQTPTTTASEKCKVVLHLQVTTTIPEAGAAVKVVCEHVLQSTPSDVSSSGTNINPVNKYSRSFPSLLSFSLYSSPILALLLFVLPPSCFFIIT
jgi:hypothetical protein